MANTRELRRRIRSVKNTSQITKAMEMVAATKMRRAQTQALSGRPYISALSAALDRMNVALNENMHPLLRSNKGQKVGVLLLSTDKSLCGALNTNLFRLIQSFISHPRPDPRLRGDGSTNVMDSRLRGNDIGGFVFYTVGKKGRQFVVKTGKELVADFENHDQVSFRSAYQISRLLIDAYLKNEVKEVYLVYPDFISTLRQDAVVKKLLPLNPSVIANEVKQSQDKIASSSKTPRNDVDGREFLFEPDLRILLDYVLNHAVETKVYQAMLETKASEHSARMIAMQNATNNAKDLVSDLELAYNQTRQEAITRELLEITSAQAALE